MSCRSREDTSYISTVVVSQYTATEMERYDIYLQGEKVRSDIDEEEMLEVTQEYAEQFYRDGTPHPDDIEVKYLGTGED